MTPRTNPLTASEALLCLLFRTRLPALAGAINSKNSKVLSLLFPFAVFRSRPVLSGCCSRSLAYCVDGQEKSPVVARCRSGYGVLWSTLIRISSHMGHRFMSVRSTVGRSRCQNASARIEERCQDEQREYHRLHEKTHGDAYQRVGDLLGLGLGLLHNIE